MVCLHPLPTHGGMMDSQIFRKAAARLPALAQIAVLRFNTRGTSSVQGTSEGAFDNARGERYDVAAAIEYAEFHDLPSIWVVGWSFGTDLAIKYAHDPGVVGAILLSPPLRFSTEEDLAVWRGSGKPLIAIVPEFDDYLRPAEATKRFAAVPQCDLIAVPDGKHLWVGQAETVLDLIVQHLNPAASPLPETWDGPMEHEAPRSWIAARWQSCFRRKTSRTSSRMAAAVGMASMAPTTPISPPPIKTAITVSTPGTSTDDRIIRG